PGPRAADSAASGPAVSAACESEGGGVTTLPIPGCATWRRPQIRNCASGNPHPRFVVMDYGLDAPHRPGMTEVGNDGASLLQLIRDLIQRGLDAGLVLFAAGRTGGAGGADDFVAH